MMVYTVASTWFLKNKKLDNVALCIFDLLLLYKLENECDIYLYSKGISTLLLSFIG